MSQQVLEGLKKLDPDNDNHWTMDGQAKLETIKFLSGGTAISREELDKIAPGFNRQAMKDYLTAEAGNVAVSQPGPTGPGAGDGGSAIIEPTASVEGSADREDEIETLAEKIASSDERVLELKRIHEQAGKDVAAEILVNDRLHDRMTTLNPAPTHQENIKTYLASVVSLRQTRALARHALATSGIDIDGLMAQAAPAPIDQALKGRSRATARR